MATDAVADPRPFHRRLGETAAGVTVIQIVVALVVAALAASRAVAHVLSPAGLVGVVAGAAATGGFISSIAGSYGGAADVLSGQAELECGPDCPVAAGVDPWAAPRLWRSAPLWSAAAAVWALAGTGLVAVVLNGKHAGLGVLFACVAVFSGSAAVVIYAIASHRGAHAARALLLAPPTPVPLRRRAWLQIALPLAVGQALVHVGMAWLLFHDYAIHEPFSPKSLTRSVALADVGIIVLALVLIFGAVFARPWAEVDARLGRIRLDDPMSQAVPAKAPIGVPGVVYAALACWILAAVVGWALPANPELWQVMVTRAAYAGVLTFVFAGVAYVRGAVNELAVNELAVGDAGTAEDIPA